MEDRIDLVDGAFWGRNPQDELKWLRENAPVWRDPRHGVWGVATYDLVKEVATHPKQFSSAHGIRPDYNAVPSMIDSDDPEHLKRRKLVNKGFTPRRVRDQEEAIRRTTRALLDAAAERGEFDLVRDVAAWVPAHHDRRPAGRRAARSPAAPGLERRPHGRSGIRRPRRSRRLR